MEDDETPTPDQEMLARELEEWLAELREKHEKEDSGPDISAPYY